jgi:hypothetical protein
VPQNARRAPFSAGNGWGGTYQLPLAPPPPKLPPPPLKLEDEEELLEEEELHEPPDEPLLELDQLVSEPDPEPAPRPSFWP